LVPSVILNVSPLVGVILKFGVVTIPLILAAFPLYVATPVDELYIVQLSMVEI
jgi:hypothetical protein